MYLDGVKQIYGFNNIQNSPIETVTKTTGAAATADRGIN